MIDQYRNNSHKSLLNAIKFNYLNQIIWSIDSDAIIMDQNHDQITWMVQNMKEIKWWIKNKFQFNINPIFQICESFWTGPEYPYWQTQAGPQPPAAAATGHRAVTEARPRFPLDVCAQQFLPWLTGVRLGQVRVLSPSLIRSSSSPSLSQSVCQWA